MTILLIGHWTVIAVWALVPVAALVHSVHLMVVGRWSDALRWLVVPVAGLAFHQEGSTAGNLVWYALNRPGYDRVIADARSGTCWPDHSRDWDIGIGDADCGTPITIVFEWGRFLSEWYGVVYDEGDQIDQLPAKRSSDWKQREIGGMLSCSGADQSLGNHFYLAHGSYTAGTDDCD